MTLRFPTLLFLLAAVILISSCGFKRDFPDLSAEELKKMLEENSGVVVVDTRTPMEYARGRIPRSQLVAEDKFFALELVLPQAKDTPLVFYCRGFG